MNIERNLNKWLIGLMLGSTFTTVNKRSQKEKDKSIFHKFINFFKGGLKEMKKDLEK